MIPREDVEALRRMPPQLASFLSKLEIGHGEKPLEKHKAAGLSSLDRDDGEMSFVGQLYVPGNDSADDDDESVVSSLYDQEGWDPYLKEAASNRSGIEDVDALSHNEADEKDLLEDHVFGQYEEDSEDDIKAEDKQGPEQKTKVQNENIVVNKVKNKVKGMNVWDYQIHAKNLKEEQAQVSGLECLIPNVADVTVLQEVAPHCDGNGDPRIPAGKDTTESQRGIYESNKAKRSDKVKLLSSLRHNQVFEGRQQGADNKPNSNVVIPDSVSEQWECPTVEEKGAVMRGERIFNSPEEYPYDCTDGDQTVGDEGDLIVPGNFTQDEIETTILAYTSRPRPYVDVNIYGIKDARCLIDSGAAVCTIDGALLDDVKARLAKHNCTVPGCESDIAVKCFGGRVIEHNYVVLLNLRIGKNNIIRNLPVLVVSVTGASRGLLLGTSFLNVTASTLSYKLDGTCTLLFGDGDAEDESDLIKAVMVGNTQGINSSETIHIMPKEVKALNVEFTHTYGIKTTLDNEAMILESDYLEEMLGYEQIQVVHPKKGRMKIYLSNQSNERKTIFKNAEIGYVTTAKSIRDAIDLAPVNQGIQSVELSEVRLINCLCSDKIGPGVGLLIALDRDDYCLFGTVHEKVSAWDSPNRFAKQTARLHNRGNYIWINGTVETPCEITDEDVNLIRKKFPLVHYHTILVPYNAGRMINLPTMNTIQKLRNVGYKVNVAAFSPSYPMEDEHHEDKICTVCLEGTLGDVLNDADKYKIQVVKIVFPTRYGQVPKGFDQKVEGTKVALFRLWEWRILYFLNTNNQVGVIVHMPVTYSAKTEQVQWHISTLMKYLKVAFPKARIDISVMSKGEHLLWLPSLEKAMKSAQCYRDFYDASLKRPRKKKDRDKKEKFNFRFVGKCGCYFCTQDKNDDDTKEKSLFSDFWGIDPALKSRIKEMEKQVKKAKQTSDKDIQDVSVIELIEASGPDDRLWSGIDEIEIINMAINECYESNLSQHVEEVCDIHLHCERGGQCADDRQIINLRQEPQAPDQVQQGFDPGDRYEYKAPVEDVSKYADIEHLTPEQRPHVLKLLEEKKNVLSVSSDDVRFIRQHYLEFDCKDKTPFFLKPYAMSHTMELEYMAHFNNLEKRGYAIADTNQRRGDDKVIFFSPSFLVWKNSQSKLEGKKEFRLVTDFSKVNALIDGSFRGDCIPNLDQLMNCFASTRYTTILDASNFFPSFRVTRNCQKYLGLSTPSGHPNMISTVCLLGVAIWPGLTQLASQCMLRKPVRKRVAQYVDDYAINSILEQYPIKKKYEQYIESGPGLNEDFFEHLSLLEDFLTDADNYGILFSFKKAKLFRQTFEYLGYQMSVGGKIDIPPNKIKALEEFPLDDDDLSVKHVQGLIGLLNYLSQATDSYSAKMYLLNQKVTEKTPKGRKWKLDPIHKQLLKELIEDAKKAPTRHVYNSSMPLDIYVDSSLTSMAAALFNRDPTSGRLYLVRFASWVHTPHDIRCLASIVKELATIMKVCRVFPHYFQHSDPELMTTIHTDQKTVMELLRNRQNDSPNAKMSRWLTAITNLNLRFKLNWTPGTSPPLMVADFGSRDPRFGHAQYVCRFSNRLDKIPQHLRPKWNGECTSEDIREFLKTYELIKWPKTDKIRVPIQDREDSSKDWDDDYDKMGMDYFLPRLSWPGREPPVPDEGYVQRAASIKTQDSICGSVVEEMRDDVGELCSLEGRIPMERHSTEIGRYCNEECISSKTLCCNDYQLKSIMIDVSALLLNTPVQRTQLRHSIEKLGKNPYEYHEIAQNQLKDPKLAKIIEKLSRGKADKQTAKTYELAEGCLLTKVGKDGVNRIVLDFLSLMVLATWTHLWAHAGENATQKALSTLYTSKYMTQVVKAICITCTTCKWSKPKLTKQDCVAGIAFKPRKIWSHIAIDHVRMAKDVTSLNTDTYKYILVCMDVASRLIIPTPVKNVKGDETARVLFNILSYIPRVNTISSDNAKGLLKSKEVSQVMDRFGIRMIHRLPRNPTSGSMIERAVQVIRVAFRLVQRFRKCESWMEAYPHVTQIINTNYRRYWIIEQGKIKSIWASPEQLAFNSDSRFQMNSLLGDREVPLSLKEKQKWKNEFQEACNHFNDDKMEIQRMIDAKFKPKIVKGDIVILKRIKAEERKVMTFYINLYEVVSRNNREVVVKCLYGPPGVCSYLYSVHAGHLELWKQDELVQYLPEDYRKALGYFTTIKSGREIPEQLWSFPETELGRGRKAIDKRLKILKEDPNPDDESVSDDSSTDTDSTSDSISSDRDRRNVIAHTPRPPDLPDLPEDVAGGVVTDNENGEQEHGHGECDDQSVETRSESRQGEKRKKGKLRTRADKALKTAKRFMGKKKKGGGSKKKK